MKTNKYNTFGCTPEYKKYADKHFYMATSKAITELEEKEIKKAFTSLLSKIKPKLTDEDKTHMQKAYKIATDGHKTQRRKSGEPYVLHPLEVARICFDEIGLGPTAVISAILHDVVEDTPYTLEDIEEAFGPKITKIVDGLTKLDGLYNVESPQAENYKKVLSTLVEDVRVVLIKMADRLHNLRTIGSMPRHKQLKIAAETSYIYVPLAHRLGQYKLKTELQDIILKITEPDMYEEITSKLRATADDRNKYIEEFINPLKVKIKQLNIPYRVTGRAKAISSISTKLKKSKVSFEEIYDIFAVRIVIDTEVELEKSFCWQVYSLITDFYKPIPERLKDWVTTPKGNGYESLHTTVIGPQGRYVEVQIRSERMDEIAERGFAAHWKYKGIKEVNSVFDRWLDGIREIMDGNQSDAIEFVNDFKTNLFAEEIYVFTPNGDMKILPKGATALDFAFDVHSDVGYKATAIKVNNKLVPMGYKLSNGDQLHVTTSKNQKPKENWLKMVVTGKARSKIRSAMKEEKRAAGEIGKETLMRKLKNLKLDFEENIDQVANHFGYNSRPDLYYALAMGELKQSDLSVFKAEGHKLVLKEEEIDAKGALAPADQPDTADTKSKKTIHKNEMGILVNGEPAGQYQHSFANCCSPVYGDDIFGYLTATNGLKIHRSACKNATHILANYGYRVLRAEWANQRKTNFVVELRLTGVDSGIGVIQMITDVMSNKLGVNIRSFSISGDEGIFESFISIMVLNKDQLNVILKTMQQLDGIQSVERVEKGKRKK